MATSAMPAGCDDSRIVNGMRQQLRWRRELLQSGKKPLGWKLAFGGPAAMERLKIQAPLVGFLMAEAVVASGSTVSLAGWKKPAAEPEIAVYVGKTLEAGADRAATIGAIEGLGAAIEIADVDHPPEDVEGTLSRDIYQRHVVLGACNVDHAGGKLTGLHGLVFRNDTEIANTSEFEALTGELIGLVSYVAELLSFFGETLRAGEIIIAGSITPPIWVGAGETFGFHLEPQEPISVRFAI
jgi:2-keto-4-pentenoate hydratase